jgi:hypothetical protein
MNISCGTTTAHFRKQMSGITSSVAFTPLQVRIISIIWIYISFVFF